MKKLIESIKQVEEIARKNPDILSISYEKFDKTSVHINDIEKFSDIATGHKVFVEDRQTKLYRYRFTVEIDGIEFYAIDNDDVLRLISDKLEVEVIESE